MTHPTLITRWTHEQDEGTEYTVWTVLQVPTDWTDDIMAEYVADRFAGERCEHEHDCCGHFYGRPGFWSWHDARAGFALVSQTFYKNI